MALKADRQARDLEEAAAEMRDLAERLRLAPVPVAELALELGEDPQQLTYRLGADTYADDLGRKVVTRALARSLIEQRNAVDAQRQAIRERAEEAARAVGERNDAENRAMLAAADRHHQKYGAHLEVSGAVALVQADQLEDEEAKLAAWLEEEAQKTRSTQRFNAAGKRVDEHGVLIDGGQP